MGVLVVVVIVVLLVRKGTVGRNLAAMRGSETATAGLGVNPSWQRIVVFALSGAIAGVGGLLHSLEQQVVSPTDWNADFSLVFVVLVVTTSVTTVEGAIQAGIGFFVTEQILSTVPAGAHRRVEPDRRAVRVRCPDLRLTPRRSARVPEAPLDGALRTTPLLSGVRRRGVRHSRHLGHQGQWLTPSRSSSCAG